MRHRSVYVDATSRPAHQPPTSPRIEASKTANAVISAILALISIGLMIGGAVMTRMNSTQQMHSHMFKEYKEFLLEWDNTYLTTFLSSHATLMLNDAVALPATQSTRPTKNTLINPPNAEDAAGQQAQPDQLVAEPKKPTKPTKPEKFRSLHVHFVSNGIMAALSLPGSGKPLLLRPSSASALDAAAELEAQPSSSKLRVTTEMLQPASFKLVVDSEGSKHTVDLGSHTFARIMNVTARSKRDCMSHQWGMWDADSQQCTVVDYLTELCFKLQEEAGTGSLNYELEHGHGGVGCYPRLGWQPDTWRRARAQLRAAAGNKDGAPGEEVWEVVLPSDAGAAPKVIIRHARDPELGERELLNRMNKIHQPAMAGHAIGLALVFLGLVGVCMVTCLAVPGLASFWSNVGHDDDDV